MTKWRQNPESKQYDNSADNRNFEIKSFLLDLQ